MSADEASCRVTVNGQEHTFPNGIKILEACRLANVYVPTMCYHSDVCPSGHCGLCVVKVNGKSMARSCLQQIQDGMSIETNAPEVIEQARKAYKKFMKKAVVPESQDIEEVIRYLYPETGISARHDGKTAAVTFKPDECINCGRCYRMCIVTQRVGALNYSDPKLQDNECISCGQCIAVCPTKAITATSSLHLVLRALAQKKVMVLQTAPAVRVAIGEAFGHKPGDIVTGKIVQAAREMGFSYVFDTSLGADLTVMEEGSELLGRIQNNGVLPQFTSCCPAWVNFVERLHPELIPHVSSTKSPHMMVGNLAKTYFATTKNINPKDMFVVSLMPCVGKKDEIRRMRSAGDVDAVITSQEFVKMIETFGIEWSLLKQSEYDSMFGIQTGGSTIFGASGGVTEAVVRFLHKKEMGKDLPDVEYAPMRGMNTIKEATITLGSAAVKIAVCNGIAAAKELVETGRYKDFQFIEVMSCRGGCVFGAGQPRLRSHSEGKQRTESVYEIDRNGDKRIACDNPEIQKLYKEYFGEPGSKKAHAQLHTHFEPQETAVLAKKKRMEKNPLVCYGSGQGMAIKMSRAIAEIVGSAPVAMNNVTPALLKKKKTVIFVVSTVGDGVFPANALKFVKALQDSAETLDEVKVAICGIGSQKHRKYCSAAYELASMLEERSAKSIIPMCLIDTDANDKGETPFEGWCGSLCEALSLKPPVFRVPQMYALTEEQGNYIVQNPMNPIGFGIVPVESKQLLTPSDSTKEWYSVTLKLPVEMSAQVGNYVKILPENPKEVVDRAIAALKVNPNVVYKLSDPGPQVKTLIPQRVSVGQLMTQYLDLMGSPSRAMMRTFMQVANADGAARLSKLLDVQHPEEMEEYMKNKSAVEFLEEYCQYGVPSMQLIISSIPHIQPRTYGISASERSQRSVELMVEMHRFDTGKERKGLSSQFISCETTKQMAISAVTGSYEYPRTMKVPQILVGIGIGIGPIMGLMEQGSSEDGKTLIIFSGERASDHQEIIGMLNRNKEAGKVNHVLLQWSDEQPGKTVADVIRSNMSLIWEYWQEVSTQLYYCGPAGDYINSIKEAMHECLVSKGCMSEKEASADNERHPFFAEIF